MWSPLFTGCEPPSVGICKLYTRQNNSFRSLLLKDTLVSSARISKLITHVINDLRSTQRNLLLSQKRKYELFRNSLIRSSSLIDIFHSECRGSNFIADFDFSLLKLEATVKRKSIQWHSGAQIIGIRSTYCTKYLRTIDLIMCWPSFIQSFSEKKWQKFHFSWLS